MRTSSLISGVVWTLSSVLALWLTYNAYTQGYIRFNYPSPQKYPVRGIDISHHQGEINWEELQRENIQFAYIKATEGGDHKDSLFDKNWKNAQKIGLTTGAYHFFTFCRTGTEQADNFISTVPKAASQLPPAIDLEFGGNCSATPEKVVLLAQLYTFIDKVTAAYGQNPVIYATRDSYNRFLANETLADIPIWIRSIYKQPQLSDNREWGIWQYAHQGRLEGVKGIIDLNVFNGTELEFKKLVTTKPQKSTVK